VTGRRIGNEWGEISLEGMEELRGKLVMYMKRKFYSRRNAAAFADEIVNQAFLDVAGSARFSAEMYNFGYMSVVCLRRAYKVFHRNDREDDAVVCLSEAVPLIDEENFVDEIVRAEDTDAVVRSLQTLKQVEQLIINERYYGDFTFREISQRHGVNLNTVLTHHRRALTKLRPMLSNYY